MRLDVGCSDAPIGDINVDIQFYYYYRGKAKVDLLCDGYYLPFKDESFEIVCSRHVIEHLENPYKFLVELVRVSKKYVYISCPNARNWRWWLTEQMDDGHLYQGFSHECLAKIFISAGLTIVNYGYRNPDPRKLDFFMNIIPYLNKREIQMIGRKNNG